MTVNPLASPRKLRCLGISIAVISIPLARLLLVGQNVSFRDHLDVFEYSMSEIIPTILPVVVAFMGVTRLQDLIRLRFLSYARIRTEAKLILTYLIGRNAAAAFLLTAAVVILAATIAFTGVLDHRILVAPAPDSYATTYWNSRILASNAFAAMLRHGTVLYVTSYSIIVATYAAIWSIAASLCVIYIKNGYIALCAPFLCYHGLNLVAGLFGRPEFSPISSIFPFNIDEQPTWTVFVFPGILLLSCLTWGGITWKRAHLLYKLS